MKYTCSFCNQHFFSSRAIDNSNYIWFYCSNCNVSYKVSSDFKLIITRFHIPFRGGRYGIDLCHNLDETHVIILPNSMDELILVILIAPYMTGITPDNCQAKLETLIIFS
jgi:hypothetical protein